MKLIITLLALILLFALISQPQLGAADASPEQVVDTSGKKLRADTKYHILPFVRYTKCRTSPSMPYTKCRSTPPTLGLASIGEQCPLDVVVGKGYHEYLPLTFTPVNPKNGVIRVSTDLNIKFCNPTSCPHHSTVWKVDRFDVSKGQWFVTTGGDVRNPGWQTIKNWFKIEKYDGTYKLVYCPSVFPNKHMCKDVGLYVDDNGNRRLALSYVPLKVKFQQA